jgi:hypothetical protein
MNLTFLRPARPLGPKKNQVSPRLRVNMAFRLQHYVIAINMAGSLVQLRNQLIKHLRGIRRKP